MTMEHKAFLFDYEEFMRQLNETLINSLLHDDREALIDFIEQNIEDIKDPNEGLPLDRSWRDTIEDGDVDEYGDFALTKFYEPLEDIGLGYEWMNIEKVLSEDFLLDSKKFILGENIGFPDRYFDPGKMGSYIQSYTQIKTNLEILLQHLDRKSELYIVLSDLIY